MKLCENVNWYSSCGVTVVALLTGMNTYDIERKMINHRRKHFPKKDDQSFTQKKIDDTNNMYWGELRVLLKKQIGKHRTVDIWDKNIKLRDFAKKVDSKNWYVVMTPDHVQIINNERVYDCNYMSDGCDMVEHIWKNKRVICYVRIKEYIKA